MLKSATKIQKNFGYFKYIKLKMFKSCIFAKKK